MKKAPADGRGLSRLWLALMPRAAAWAVTLFEPIFPLALLRPMAVVAALALAALLWFQGQIVGGGFCH